MRELRREGENHSQPEVSVEVIGLCVDLKLVVSDPSLCKQRLDPGQEVIYCSLWFPCIPFSDIAANQLS